jgi:NADH-quinone oxidoreductase subunit N
MAYSSIAHSGYMLIGLAVALAGSPADGATGGLGAMILYLFVYVFATLGVFAALTHLGSRDREVNRVDELAGIGRTRPMIAAILAVCLFSLSGVPPMAGFWGKLSLFGSAVRLATATPSADVQWWFTVLAVVGVLNAAVAAAYYLRIVGVMYFRSQETAPAAQGGLGAWGAAAAAAAITVAIGLLPSALMEDARRAEFAAQGRVRMPEVSALPTEQNLPR